MIIAATIAIYSIRHNLIDGRNTKFTPRIELSKEKKATKIKIMQLIVAAG